MHDVSTPTLRAEYEIARKPKTLRRKSFILRSRISIATSIAAYPSRRGCFVSPSTRLRNADDRQCGRVACLSKLSRSPIQTPNVEPVLFQLVELLPSDQRRVIELRYAEQKSLREISMTCSVRKPP